MQQQFFVGDKVCLADKIIKHSHVLWIDEIEKSKGIMGVVQTIVTYESGDIGYSVKFDNRYYNCDTKWLTIVERVWQKNTGRQPVDDEVEVLAKRTDGTINRAEACMFSWYEGDIGSIVEWRIADSVSSDEEQPEAIPPSHVALGDELVSADVPSKQDTKHSHYFKKCGYDYVDVYRTIKMFGVTDPCLQHAVKKLLVTGGRGFKDIETDVQDVIDTLERWKEMFNEDRARGD